MIPATSAFRSGSKVKERRPNRVSPALYKGERSGRESESGEATELRESVESSRESEERRSCVEVLRSLETTAGERAEENGEPRAEGAATQLCRANLRVRVERESRRELASQRQGSQR